MKYFVFTKPEVSALFSKQHPENIEPDVVKSVSVHGTVGTFDVECQSNI